MKPVLHSPLRGAVSGAGGVRYGKGGLYLAARIIHRGAYNYQKQSAAVVIMRQHRGVVFFFFLQQERE